MLVERVARVCDDRIQLQLSNLRELEQNQRTFHELGDEIGMKDLPLQSNLF